MDLKTSKSLMAVALGHEPADLVITAGNLFNVFTGETLSDCAVAVKGRRIAYVGKNPDKVISKDTHVIDASGRTLIPGLIDGHTHIAWMNTPEEFLKTAMAGGTTTIITEIFEPYPVAGYAGILEFLRALKDQPIKIYATAPAMVSISRRTRGIDLGDLEALLSRDDVLGLGEAYWQGILQSPEVYLPAFIKTLGSRKTLEGHSAGANEKNLNAYVATGISSCHEAIKAREALDRMRLGLYTMIREGSVRKELEAISEITQTGADLRRLVLVSDGVSPEALLENGYMEHIIQKAIDYGFKPADAVRMATLNVAEHFLLDGQVGAIAPGRYADILILPAMDKIKPECVISNGKVIARNGKSLVAPRPHLFSGQSLNSIRLPRELRADDFVIPAGTGKARIIELITDLVTRERHLQPPVTNGEVKPDPTTDIIKVAAIDRAKIPGEMFVGLLKGFGLTSGAMALSGPWDSADIIVVGTDDADMACAVNRIRKLEGGVVVCDRGKILAELALPIFGVISDQPIAVVAEKTRAIRAAASGLGVPHPDPMLTLSTLTTAAIPFFRICEEGYVNLKDGRTVGLWIDS